MIGSGDYNFATVDIRALPDDALDDIIGGASVTPGSCLGHMLCVE